MGLPVSRTGRHGMRMRRQTRTDTPHTRPTRATRRSTPPVLLDDRAIAEMLSISPSMARKLRRLGELPEVRIGAAVRVRATDVVAYLDRVSGATR